MSVLIVVWFAVSQSYMRTTEYVPNVSMQEFRSEDLCLKAGKAIKDASGPLKDKVVVLCVPK